MKHMAGRKRHSAEDIVRKLRRADELAAEGRTGEEIAAAEKWLLSKAVAQQPWDRSDWSPPSIRELDSVIGESRAKVLAASLGHYPAPLAILDCLQFGLPQCFDGAIRSEMAIFSHLIQRPEPRNMIQSLFLGKTDYDRRAKRGELPDFVGEVLAVVQAVLSENEKHRAALGATGFSRMADRPPPNASLPAGPDQAARPRSQSPVPFPRLPTPAVQ